MHKLKKHMRLLLFCLILLSFNLSANKARDYSFVNKLVYFSLENNVSLYKELRQYIDESKQKYQQDKDFVAILESKALYARRSYKEAKKLILRITDKSKYYYNVYYDLYNFSIYFKDEEGILIAVKNIFKKLPSDAFIRKVGRNTIRELVRYYLEFLNKEGRKREVVRVKNWLKKNNITTKDTASVGKRIRHWESILRKVNEYEEKYLGLYAIKNLTIDSTAKTSIMKQIKIWEAKEKKENDLITLMILMEIARARLIMGEYKTAERIVADNFTQLKAEHNTSFAKDKEISPFLSARYILGLCYLIRAQKAYAADLKDDVKALLIGGTKIYKNGAAQNFYFILKEGENSKEGEDSYYKWKAFDRYEYATRVNIKEWLGGTIPSLVTSKSYGLQNINRLFQQKRYKQLLKSSALVLNEQKFSKKQKLEVYKDVLSAHIYLNNFVEVEKLIKLLEQNYQSVEDKKGLASSYQFAGKTCFKLRDFYESEGNFDLSNKYRTFMYYFIEKSFELNDVSPLNAELIYILVTDQYNFYLDKSSSKEEKDKTIEKCIFYANIIIDKYPSYLYFFDIIHWVAGIYEDLLNANKHNKKLAEKYTKKVLEYNKLYLAKTSNYIDFRLKRIFSLYAIANIYVLNKETSFKKGGFIYYVKQINENLKNISMFSTTEQTQLKNIANNIYLDEKIIYEIKIKEMQSVINNFSEDIETKELSPAEFASLKKKQDDALKQQRAFVTSLIRIVSRALESGYYNQKGEDKVLYNLANYYDLLNNKEKSEHFYKLLLTKYPQSVLSRSIIYREASSFILKNKLEKAVDSFNNFRNELASQDDEVIADWYEKFFKKEKPYQMKEALFNKFTKTALFCAQIRLRKLKADEKRKRNFIRLDIANCYYNLKDYKSVHDFTSQIIKNRGAGFYQALILTGNTYKLENKPVDAFKIFGQLYSYVSKVNVDDLIAKKTEWDANTKKLKSEEFKERFVFLKYSSLASSIELSYEIKNYKKALFYIYKMEGQLSSAGVQGLESYYEMTAAVKIIATSKLKKDVNLVVAVQQFGQSYPNSEWLAKVRAILN